MIGEVFHVFSPDSRPPSDRPSFRAAVFGTPPPLEGFADVSARALKRAATDVTILSNKPSKLRDGTPVQEIEFRMVQNGVPKYLSYLFTTKSGAGILTAVISPGKIGDDLKAMLYSVEFQPAKDEPVKVPDDVKEFLDRHCSASVAHDLAKIMADYSDRYLNSGVTRGEMERFHKQMFGPDTSFDIVVTEFVPAGERVYLTGFVTGWFGKATLFQTSIIKENGEWKWYGNQREVAP